MSDILTGFKTFIDLRKEFAKVDIKVFPVLLGASETIPSLHAFATEHGLLMSLSKFKMYYATTSGSLTFVILDDLIFLYLILNLCNA